MEITPFNGTGSAADDAACKAGCNAADDGSRIEFPVSFDLKLIYELSSASALNADLLAVFARRSVACSALDAKEAKPGAKYGRISARVTFSSLEQLRTTYAEIGSLAYVKGLI